MCCGISVTWLNLILCRQSSLLPVKYLWQTQLLQALSYTPARLSAKPATAWSARSILRAAFLFWPWQCGGDELQK